MYNNMYNSRNTAIIFNCINDKLRERLYNDIKVDTVIHFIVCLWQFIRKVKRKVNN